MRFDPPLQRATLVRRYKRFLADVILPDGTAATAHCPNPGAMTGLAEPGCPIWLAPARNPKAKLPWSWKLVDLPGGGFAGIDTTLPNRLVAEALGANALPELAGYATHRPEVAYSIGSRVDFLLQGPGRRDAYLEVKNVHLNRHASLAEFPDCVTARGRKHLSDLSRMVAEGHRAVLLYLVQMTGPTAMAIAEDIDPAYARAVEEARAAGVEMLAYGTDISPHGITISRRIPVLGHRNAYTDRT